MSISTKSAWLKEELDKQATRLESMDTKITDAHISDIALIFLDKEIKKQNEMICSISQSLTGIENQIDDQRIKIRTR